MTHILLKSTCDGLSNDILIVFFGYVVAKDFIIEDCIPTLTYYSNLIKLCENSLFHYFFIDLNAPSSKIQISLSVSPNFMTKILLKSTCDGLSDDILIIFFGYVVAKIFIFEDCVPTLKYYWNLIKPCENSIFHYFFIDLNAPTSKIQISLNKSSNFMTQILIKSTCNGLSNDILIIFFGYVVVKNFIIKDCVSTLKYYWNLIKLCENSIFHYYFIDLNAPTSKIQISLNKSPNFIT